MFYTRLKGESNITAKELLLQPQKLTAIIQRRIVELQQLKELAHSITANVSQERVSASGDHQKMASLVDRAVDMESEITTLFNQLMDTNKEVSSVIERLPPAEYDVLHKRYIQGMTFYEIADQKGREYSWATTTHGRALKNVQKIIDQS